MRVARIGLVFALFLAGCVAEPPPPPPPAPPPPPPPPGWEPITSITPDALVTSGYVQERGLQARGANRRAWILLNLREPYQVPQNGAQAVAVRYMAEYRCTQREWRPLEGAWFARPNGQGPAVFAERVRNRRFQPAEAGTLGGAFLDAACGL